MKSIESFLQGARDGIPIALGYISVSFAFGMLAVEKGLPLWSPLLISITNFTGTGQFMGIDLIASGVAFAELTFAILIINMRYFLMSLSLSQRLPENMPLWRRLVIAFGNTDEIFAVSMQKPAPLGFSYMMGLILVPYIGWNFGTMLGSVASSALPLSVRSALGIAIFAMFIAIIIPPARTMKPIAKIILVSVVLSCCFRYIPFLSQLSSGWVIIICGVVSAALGAYLYPVDTEETRRAGDSNES